LHNCALLEPALAKKDEQDNDLGRNFALGLEVAVGATLGYFVGGWVDRRFGTTPWGLYVGVMVGCAAGMYSLIKAAIRMNKD
jgi:ATP synthase protein I